MIMNLLPYISWLFVMCSYQFILCLSSQLYFDTAITTFVNTRLFDILSCRGTGTKNTFVIWGSNDISYNLPWTQTCKLNNPLVHINPTSKVCCQKIYRQACLKSSLARKIRFWICVSDIAERSIGPPYLNIWFYQTL